MTRRTTLAVTAALLFATGCSDSMSEETTPDGVEKDYGHVGEKGDRWNEVNDPSRFQTDLNRDWSELKQKASSGETDNEVWPATYWPLYKGGINQRWQGEDTLSPAEKYDAVFNNWAPERGYESFLSLQPFDHDTCEYDEAYYDKLGPAARQAARDSIWRAHNGRDDDGDGVSDSEECGHGSDADYDGVGTWFGYCHAWAPAAILTDEPKNPVTMETDSGREVTFSVSDIKALIISQYERSESYMIGARCNDKEVERDEETGRIPDGKCQDVNAGSFHVVMTNFLGLQERPIVEDRVYNFEVWNQPMTGYEITKQEEIDESRVKSLVNPDASDPDELSDEEGQAVVRAANTLSKTELVDEAGLREDRAETLVTFRSSNGTFESLSNLRDEVDERSIARLLDYARDSGWVEAPDSSIYDYDESADRYIEVKMKVDYITESSPSTRPLASELGEYTRHDRYHYIIELDEDGTITGGEWIGESLENHPDFLWLPTGPGGGISDINMERVRTLVERSRNEGGSDSSGGDTGTGDADTGSGDAISGSDDVGTGSNDAGSSGDDDPTFANSESTDIPDGEPDGIVSELDIDREGTVSTLKIDLSIEHDYRGDLVVFLEKEGTRVLLHDGREVDQPWRDNVQFDGKNVDGFGGLDISGTWKLKVVDLKSPDAGSLESWTLYPTRR